MKNKLFIHEDYCGLINKNIFQPCVPVAINRDKEIVRKAVQSFQRNGTELENSSLVLCSFACKIIPNLIFIEYAFKRLKCGYLFRSQM